MREIGSLCLGRHLEAKETPATSSFIVNVLGANSMGQNFQQCYNNVHYDSKIINSIRIKEGKVK